MQIKLEFEKVMPTFWLEENLYKSSQFERFWSTIGDLKSIRERQESIDDSKDRFSLTIALPVFYSYTRISYTYLRV